MNFYTVGAAEAFDKFAILSEASRARIMAMKNPAHLEMLQNKMQAQQHQMADVYNNALAGAGNAPLPPEMQALRNKLITRRQAFGAAGSALKAMQPPTSL